MVEQRIRLYAFGPFQLDPQERLLRRDGTPVPLAPKAVETLILLVQHGGHMVDKDQLMKQVWPDTFVEEGNLTKNIFMLRKALGKQAGGQEYIETMPKRGYRFAAAVKEFLGEEDHVLERHTRTRMVVEEIGDTAEVHTQEHTGPRQAGAGARLDYGHGGGELDVRTKSAQTVPAGMRRGRVVIVLVASLLLLALAGVSLFRWLSPLPPVRVLKTTQITRIGRVEGAEGMATGGGRLYFSERTGGHWSLAQVALQGGEPVPIPAPFRNASVFDISPNLSELLVGSFTGISDERAVWVLPVQGGSPRRVGDIFAGSAAWTQDGREILYAHGSDVYLVASDGVGPQKLFSTAGHPRGFRWSPSGDALRFTLSDPKTPFLSLWEASRDGTHLHPLLPGWNNSLSAYGDGESCGYWTPDGKYFVFKSSQDGIDSVWVIREKGSLFHAANRNPVLVSSPGLSVASIFPLTDSRRIFLAGAQERRELVRYDAKLRRLVAYLSGIPARWISFSPDKRWVAYARAPEFNLWRSRADGSERLQLTFPPLSAFAPRWSPDGRRIVFAARLGGKKNVFFILPDGGKAEAILSEQRYEPWDPVWTPDGNSLTFAFMTPETASEGGGLKSVGLYMFDLKSREIRNLPGSEGLRLPVWSPEGNHLAASSVDGQKLVLYDFQSHRWVDLAEGATLSAPYWSGDGKYVYFQDLFGGREQPIFRVRVDDRKVERVTNLADSLSVDVAGASLAGLAPDDSPLATLIRYNSDIYTLDVDFP